MIIKDVQNQLEFSIKVGKIQTLKSMIDSHI